MWACYAFSGFWLGLKEYHSCIQSAAQPRGQRREKYIHLGVRNTWGSLFAHKDIDVFLRGKESQGSSLYGWDILQLILHLYSTDFTLPWNVTYNDFTED